MWTGLSAAAVSICREPAKHWRNPFSASLYTRWRWPRLREFSANQLLCHVFLVASSPGNTEQRWSMRSCSPSIVCDSRFSYCPLSGHAVANLTSCSLQDMVICNFSRNRSLSCEILSLIALSLSTCIKRNTMSDWINTDCQLLLPQAHFISLIIIIFVCILLLLTSFLYFVKIIENVFTMMKNFERWTLKVHILTLKHVK